MAAQITIDKVEAKVKPYKVDQLGYLYCGDCLDCGRGGEVKALQPHRTHHGVLDTPRTDRCDRCSKTSEIWPLHTITATVITEHTMARIF